MLLQLLRAGAAGHPASGQAPPGCERESKHCAGARAPTGKGAAAGCRGGRDRPRGGGVGVPARRQAGGCLRQLGDHSVQLGLGVSQGSGGLVLLERVGGGVMGGECVSARRQAADSRAHTSCPLHIQTSPLCTLSCAAAAPTKPTLTPFFLRIWRSRDSTAARNSFLAARASFLAALGRVSATAFRSKRRVPTWCRGAGRVRPRGWVCWPPQPGDKLTKKVPTLPGVKRIRHLSTSQAHATGSTHLAAQLVAALGPVRLGDVGVQVSVNALLSLLDAGLGHLQVLASLRGK